VRRGFFWRLFGLSGLGLGSSASAQAPPKSRILIKSAWGSADPTQASFPFHHANAFAEAGHDLLGKNATFANPTIFVGLVQWADKVLTE
jgi:hypothetical protein